MNKYLRLIGQIVFLVILTLLLDKVGLTFNERPFSTVLSFVAFNGFAAYLLYRAFPEDLKNDKKRQD